VTWAAWAAWADIDPSEKLEEPKIKRGWKQFRPRFCFGARGGFLHGCISR
jgi:hypothetical protein